ncbi:MAG TPA: DNA polymerase III subunit [Bacteroidales bacterium]|jgi:DNA polymerase-3 subunit delta'|nr:DNA polymerase III subunit [Bacteroidales bacterium]
MRFGDVIGDGALKENLIRMVEQKRLSHAILFREEPCGGGLAFALALGQYVNCRHRCDGDSCGTCPTCNQFQKLIHPDLHFAFPVNSSKDVAESQKGRPIADHFLDIWRELVLNDPYFAEQDLYEAIGIDNKSGNISVHEAKRIIERLLLRSFEANYKVMVIWLPEKMNQECANKLLKLLEEPPAGTLFLLVSQAPEKLLATIRSRCQLIEIPPMTEEQRQSLPQVISQDPAEYRDLLTGLIEAGIAKKLIDTFAIWETLSDMGREKQKEFCLYSERFIRKLYMTSQGLEQIAETLPQEEMQIRDLASRITPGFYEKALSAFDRTLSAIESNTNSKLTFCDLSNRLLLYL